MVQTTTKFFIKDPYDQSRKYKCGNKKFGHEIKRLWFENADTIVALRTTATTIWLLHVSKPHTMPQFSPSFSNVVTSDNVMPKFDWLCDVCGYVMSPTSGSYWVNLGFNNNYKES